MIFCFSSFVLACVRECGLCAKKIFVVQIPTALVCLCLVPCYRTCVFWRLINFYSVHLVSSAKLIHYLLPVGFSLEVGPYPREGLWMCLTDGCVLLLHSWEKFFSDHSGLRYSQGWSMKCVELLQQCGHPASPSAYPSWSVLTVMSIEKSSHCQWKISSPASVPTSLPKERGLLKKRNGMRFPLAPCISR